MSDHYCPTCGRMATPGVKSRALELAHKRGDRLRAALVEVRDVLFGITGPPDEEEDDSWEVEIWKILNRAIGGKS